jgi:hypothetical protein
MAAHASAGAPRSWGPVARIKAFTGRLKLDRSLARGVIPGANSALARRAEVLQRRHVRRRLAGALEDAIAEAVEPSHGESAAVPVQRDEVLAAQHDLERLVAALRAEPGPPVRAVAMASLLLTDGTGPLFAPHPHGTLAEAAFRAAFHSEAA